MKKINKLQIACSAFLMIIVLQQLVVQGTTATAFEINEEEEELLEQIRPLFLEMAPKEFMKTDGYMLRWLYAHDFDLENTMEAFRSSLQWREQNRIDGIIHEDFKIVMNDLPVLLDGSVDKDGRPIFIQRLGYYDIRKIIQAGYTDKYIRYFIRIDEIQEHLIHHLGNQTTTNATKARARPILQTFAIIDMTGFSMKKTGCFACAAAGLKVLASIELNYPNICHKLIFINTPQVFHTFLNSIRGALSPLTRNGLFLYGYDKEEWSKVLLELIPPDQLLVQYGGTRQFGLDNNSSSSCCCYSSSSSSMHANFNSQLWFEKNAQLLESLFPKDLTANQTEESSADLDDTCSPRSTEHHHHHYKEDSQIKSNNSTSVSSSRDSSPQQSRAVGSSSSRAFAFTIFCILFLTVCLTTTS